MIVMGSYMAVAVRRVYWTKVASLISMHYRCPLDAAAATALDSRQPGGRMDQDDLPPQPEKPSDSSTLGGTLGQTFGGFVFIALFLAIAGVVLYFVVRWFG
jgi:hypothetical protein